MTNQPEGQHPVPEEAVEAVIEFRCSKLAHRPAGDVLYRWRIEAREDLEAGASYIEASVLARLKEGPELDVLCGELRHIAEKGCVPSGPKEGLVVDVLTWAEAWFLQLSGAPNLEPNQGDDQKRIVELERVLGIAKRWIEAQTKNPAESERTLYEISAVLNSEPNQGDQDPALGEKGQDGE